MRQRTERPISPSSATQRGFDWFVPLIAHRNGVTGSISSSGTLSGRDESTSAQ
jgi:hypothetical protein